jgi:hypothetical protein
MLSQSILNLFIKTVALWILPLFHNLPNSCPLSLFPMRMSKSLGLDDIPGFVIKGCSDIFIPILRHVFNISLTQQYFPTVWNEAALLLVL